MDINQQFLQEKFVCAKCRGHKCIVDEVKLVKSADGKLARLLPLTSVPHLAVTCALCGYVEFYNAACHAPCDEAEKKSELAEGAENA